VFVAHEEVLAHYIDAFQARGIRLDPFQIEACEALNHGRDVLVSAPTGAGKTVVAHYAVELALATSTRCIYTAPIKALSNQKFHELTARLGQAIVGLLTGDTTINRDAQILIVTTEVLRNILFQDADYMADVGYVVLDEIHYLADKDRGPVWEEVILSLPEHVRLVSLSATIANTHELVSWLESVRGATSLIESTTRPVPLEQYVAVGKKIIPLYGSDGRASKALRAALRQHAQAQPREERRMSDGARRRLIFELDSRTMLPAIHFIFSRKGCDLAAQALLRANVTLTSPHEQRLIRAQIATLRDSLSESDRRAVHLESAAASLIRGFGVHHAGILPALKTLTENLMEQGLLRIVYATGTLALGIDMPVRTVVLEDLRRFNGQGFVDLTATEYTQLIGRAGRRGKDSVGNAVVVAQSELDPDALAELGSGRVEPLLSAFHTSYNTVVNLLAEHTQAEARGLLSRSFAQFQKNADIGQIAGRAERIRRRIEKEEKALTCSHGDIVGYVRTRAALGRASKAARRAAKREYRERIADSFADAVTGHLYAYARDDDVDYAVALSVEPERIRVLTWLGELVWLREKNLRSELRDLGTIELPTGLSFKHRSTRATVADRIIDAVEERSDLGLDRDLLGSWSRFAVPASEELNHHPCAACPHLDAHLRKAETLLSLDARLSELDELTRSFTDSVGRDFDKTVQVLLTLGILQRDGATVRLGLGAHTLRHLHVESDLLLYQCLAALPNDALDPAEMAGWASMFLEDDRLGSHIPRDETLGPLAWNAKDEAEFLQQIEHEAGIERTGEPTPGCAEVFTNWARGATLESCLKSSRMEAGDFLSGVRRLADLLGQIAATGDYWFAQAARRGRDAIRHSELL
jgi:ATP-dependent RNA helicase HelY